MIRRSLAAATVALILGAGSATAQQPGSEQRCGWLDNPTPGNASLYDKDGEWTIAVQGGHQAEGDWSPPYKPGEWRKSGNASYGYGCACLTVKVDAEEKNILEVVSAKARPLSACRKDKALSAVEKQLR
ncbi:DUF4087 domain-containing protein [Bosea sp. (in: a-proteobacteria)]|jgi:hypothetical protein|uniref:DUF4087 domain-containing protein n=1 Tax=Bosea sp. (in: a-proteobacteria) TaxID=1871050 RepID=UPI002DDCABA2|nr:DUF4087 domain-containing protein [Bosea sp. (in: a-proteobacteria)]HEV2511647.1 DUF4087 domain-containing protein [Bosea sp. (in: a-proteobacteria)]